MKYINGALLVIACVLLWLVLSELREIKRLAYGPHEVVVKRPVEVFTGKDSLNVVVNGEVELNEPIQVISR